MSIVSACEQKLFRLYFSFAKGSHRLFKPCCNDFVVKNVSKVFFFFMLPFASSFKIFINVVTFLYVKANSKEIGAEILFPSFFSEEC